ncbi:MAG: hypothetical protein IJ120_02635 [Solobacterium sp.]|nr:hypothetical protein [Solobacterium sp.]
MFKLYTTKDLTRMLHCNEHVIGYYRKYGMLKGIRVGHGYAYSEQEIEQWYEHYRGCDLSNEDAVRIAVKLRGIPDYKKKSAVSSKDPGALSAAIRSRSHYSTKEEQE